MINRLHGKVKGHEFNDGPEPAHGCTRADAGKAIFGDRGIDHPFGAKFLQQALGHLVGTLILGNFLTHDENAVIAAHFFGHGIAQCFAHG